MIPETVFGLPFHPLIVHAVVVLGPLSAAGLVAIALVPRWRRPYGPLVALGAVSTAVSGFIATVAGEALKESLQAGGPVLEKIEQHEELGETLRWLLLAQAVLSVALVLVDRRGASRGVVLTVSVVSVVVSLVATAWVIRTGHVGSEAVWFGIG